MADDIGLRYGSSPSDPRVDPSPVLEGPAPLRIFDTSTTRNIIAAPPNLISVGFSAGTNSTSSISDGSLFSTLLPSSALSAAGSVVRAATFYSAITQNCTINIKFGVTTLLSFVANAGTNGAIYFQIYRTDGSSLHTQTELWYTIEAVGAVFPARITDTTDDTSAGVLLDFRGSVVAGGTLAYRAIIGEFLA